MARRGHGEGSIYQRSDGRWCASLRLPNGKRKSFYAETRKAAQDALRAAQRQQDQGLPVDVTRQTVSQFFESWLTGTVKVNLRVRTYEAYSSHARLHICPALGNLKLSYLSPQHIAQLYASLLAKGLSPRSIRCVHTVLHRGLDQALRWNLIVRNPAQAVSTPRAKRHEIKPLSPEQIGLLLEAAAGTRLYVLYLLALTTGMRQGELLGLRWADIDGEMLSVRQQVTRIAGGLQFSEPKSASGRRTIALPASTVDVLRQHRKAQLEERLAAGSLWQDNDLVFPTGMGKPMRASNLVSCSFEPLLRKAGLAHVRFHDLRHSAATLLLSQGVHPKVVQERLGHSSIGTTMDTYSHVLPNMQQEAASKLDAFLSSL